MKTLEPGTTHSALKVNNSFPEPYNTLRQDCVSGA